MESQEQTSVKQWIAKWCIVIAFAGLVFYIVYPKYFVKFGDASSRVRVNQITGKTELFVPDKDGKFHWKDTSAFYE